MVHITRLTARSGNGVLSGTGTGGFVPYALTSLALDLTADHVQIANTRETKAAASGHFYCAGPMEHPRCHGEIALHDTVLRPVRSPLQSAPPPVDPTIVVIDTAANPPTSGEVVPADAMPRAMAEPAATLYQRLAMALSVRIPSNTWMHVREGSVEWEGQLSVHKESGAETALTGTLSTVRGWYAFQGRTFRVEKGQIVFNGGSPMNPALEIVGRYPLPQYRIEAVIGGTANAPTLTLRSEPSLEPADILALLMFGRPVNSLTQTDRSSLQSQVLKTTVGYIAADVQQSIAQMIGVETLEFEMGTSMQQSCLGIGKYLLEGVFVSTWQTLGDTFAREVTIEYQFDPHWQLRGTSTSQGNSGIDLLWRRQY